MMLSEEMRRVVTEPFLGFVATVSPDGTANLSPKEEAATRWRQRHLDLSGGAARRRGT